MSDGLEVIFASLSAKPEPTCVALAGQDVALGPTVQALNEKSNGAILKAVEAAGFQGKSKTAIELLAPARLKIKRLIIAGCGKLDELASAPIAVRRHLARSNPVSRN